MHTQDKFEHTDIYICVYIKYMLYEARYVNMYSYRPWASVVKLLNDNPTISIISASWRPEGLSLVTPSPPNLCIGEHTYTQRYAFIIIIIIIIIIVVVVVV
jgi:hypothetical protein